MGLNKFKTQIAFSYEQQEILQKRGCLSFSSVEVEYIKELKMLLSNFPHKYLLG